MNVNRAIRTLRKKKGLKQVELADKAGLTQAYISKLEAGKVEPTITALNKICSALGTSLPFLFFEAIDDSDVKEGRENLYRDLKPILLKLEQLFD